MNCKKHATDTKLVLISRQSSVVITAVKQIQSPEHEQPSRERQRNRTTAKNIMLKFDDVRGDPQRLDSVVGGHEKIVKTRYLMEIKRFLKSARSSPPTQTPIAFAKATVMAVLVNVAIVVVDVVLDAAMVVGGTITDEGGGSRAFTWFSVQISSSESDDLAHSTIIGIIEIIASIIGNGIIIRFASSLFRLLLSTRSSRSSVIIRLLFFQR